MACSCDIGLDFADEGRLSLKDVESMIKDGQISSLPCTKEEVYLNITTADGIEYCIHLDISGFKVTYSGDRSN